MKSKAKSQDCHTKRRMAERLGLKYSDRLYQFLFKSVRNGKAKLVKRQSLRVAIYEVEYLVKDEDTLSFKTPTGNIKIRYVYDKNRKTIVTILPFKYSEPTLVSKLEEVF